MKYFGVFILAVLVLCAPVVAAEKYDPSKGSLEAALKADVRLTTTKMDGSISGVGTKFTVKMDNLKAVPSTYVPITNVIENGVRKEPNIGSRMLIGALNKGTRKISGIQIDTGTQVGIKRVEVGKDSISLLVITLKAEKVSVKGDDQSEYMHTLLYFRFRDLDTMDTDSVKQAIYAVLEPEGGTQIAASPAPTTEKLLAKPPQETSSSAAHTAGDNDLVGKTPGELIELFGSNFKVVTVGDRIIYIFPDLGIRVPVVNGKVVAGQ